MNGAINLSSNATETSFVNAEEDSQNYSNENNNDSDELYRENTLLEPPTKTKVAVPRNERSLDRLNKQTLGKIAQSLKIY